VGNKVGGLVVLCSRVLKKLTNPFKPIFLINFGKMNNRKANSGRFREEKSPKNSLIVIKTGFK